MWYMGEGPWGAGGLAMGLFMGFFWIVAVIFAAAIIWALFRGSTPRTRDFPSSGLHILEERYARGEISKEEFDQKKRDLLH